MIETISQHEERPADYPAIGGLTELVEITVWQRIEFYTAWRFSPRKVTWQVNSDGGEWAPLLRPVTDLTAKRWTGAAFEAVTLTPAPGGWVLPPGRYEIEATVGAGPVPEAVETAVQRLADYMMAQSDMPAGVRSYSANVGQLSESMTRAPDHMARALQNSGAADLLRPYRRV